MPRGEPRRLLAAVAEALAAREPADVLRERLTAAAERGLDEAARAPTSVRLALAYRLALPYLARDASIKEALADVEPLLEGWTRTSAPSEVPRSPALPRRRSRSTSSC